MVLAALLEKLEYELVSGSEDMQIENVVYDSRKVTEGSLFICIEGGTADGHTFIPDVVKKGAKALIVTKDVSGLLPADADVTVIRVKDSRYALAFVSAAYFGHPAEKLKVIGITGSVGKTTTIGKLAAKLTAAGRKVYIGAADTFRAAAIDQLAVWAERAGATMIRQEMGSDPASVAYDTLRSAVANGADVVIIDTAGRLHNKINLMNELTKIRNVMAKVIPGAPHEVMLVLDGSTGQNAFEQARQFTQATQVTSLAITKLDGTAKGGVVIGISDQFRIPVRYIGVGERIDQLQLFDRRAFVEALFGDETK